VPIITEQEKKRPRTTVSVRLESTLTMLLDAYCDFIQSSRQYVIHEAVRLTITRDPDFQKWLAIQDSPAQPMLPALQGEATNRLFERSVRTSGGHRTEPDHEI
jgi:hypothetical protein